MVSTHLNQQITDLEIIISRSDEGFQETGLKADSLIRSSRLAVAGEEIFEGKIGSLPSEWLQRVRTTLASWIVSDGGVLQ